MSTTLTPQLSTNQASPKCLRKRNGLQAKGIDALSCVATTMRPVCSTQRNAIRTVANTFGEDQGANTNVKMPIYTRCTYRAGVSKLFCQRAT